MVTVAGGTIVVDVVDVWAVWAAAGGTRRTGAATARTPEAANPTLRPPASMRRTGAMVMRSLSRTSAAGAGEAQDGAEQRDAGQVPDGGQGDEAQHAEGGQYRVTPIEPRRPPAGLGQWRCSKGTVTRPPQYRNSSEESGDPRQAGADPPAHGATTRGRRMTSGVPAARSTTASWQPSRSTSAARIARPPCTRATAVAFRSRPEWPTRRTGRPPRWTDGRGPLYGCPGIPSRRSPPGRRPGPAPTGVTGLKNPVGVTERIGAAVSVDISQQHGSGDRAVAGEVAEHRGARRGGRRGEPGPGRGRAGLDLLGGTGEWQLTGALSSGAGPGTVEPAATTAATTTTAAAAANTADARSVSRPPDAGAGPPQGGKGVGGGRAGGRRRRRSGKATRQASGRHGLLEGLSDGPGRRPGAGTASVALSATVDSRDPTAGPERGNGQARRRRRRRRQG